MTDNKAQFTINVKADTEAKGTFYAPLSVYGIVDRANEVTDKGCFDNTIAIGGSRRVMLWGHNAEEAIGSLELIDTDDALMVKGHLCLDTARGKEAYSLLTSDPPTPLGLSIGYAVKNDKWDADGVRHLTELELYEGSIVTIPCNPACVIDSGSVKGVSSMSDDEPQHSRFDDCKFLSKLSKEDREEAIAELEALFAEDEEKEEEMDDEKSKSEPVEADEAKETEPETEEQEKSEAEDEEEKSALIKLIKSVKTQISTKKV